MDGWLDGDRHSFGSVSMAGGGLSKVAPFVQFNADAGQRNGEWSGEDDGMAGKYSGWEGK